MQDIPIVKRVHVEDWPAGQTTLLRLDMVGNGLGQTVRIPAIVVRGTAPGPTLGLTAALHGNELNGIRVIHDTLRTIDPTKLRGAIVAVPVVNVPGYIAGQRAFNDGQDLNRLMPGKPNGTGAQVYAHRFMDRLVRHLSYLIDLHTASFGRVNSLYVRADMSDPTTARMAYEQNPQIILHNCGEDGTLRSAAVALGIPAITVEVGNPQRFQQGMIRSSLEGVQNVLADLEMIDEPVRTPEPEAKAPVLCVRSYWLYTTSGGVLEVLPGLCDRVEKGELVARVTDIYGRVVEEYCAPEDGVVIGKSNNPVNQTGSRILHLGIPGTADEVTLCPVPQRPVPQRRG